jgi:hypothetical protein
MEGGVRNHGFVKVGTMMGNTAWPALAVVSAAVVEGLMGGVG